MGSSRKALVAINGGAKMQIGNFLHDKGAKLWCARPDVADYNDSIVILSFLCRKNRGKERASMGFTVSRPREA